MRYRQAIHKISLKDIVNEDLLNRYCSLVFNRPIEKEASNYFARLMFRHIEALKDYIPEATIITPHHIWTAAGRYF